MSELLGAVLSLNMLSATLRLSTPLIYAAIGGLFSERSGVINIALEGMMLFGAFVAVVGTFYTGNPWLGLLLATVVGGLIGLVHAWLSVSLKADQIVSATAINILAVGIPNFLLLRIWHKPGASPLVESIHSFRVPLLADLPGVGPFFAQQNPLIYAALLLVPLAHFVLFRTPWGLRLRAVGEHPRAADTVGIDVYRMRYGSVILSGMLAAIGGAYLSVVQLSAFSKQMTQGRGFIALGALIFGKWRPFNTLVACLLFGGADALQLVLQAQGVPIPADFLLALPYALTLVAVIGFVGRSIPPAAIGKPYEKG